MGYPPQGASSPAALATVDTNIDTLLTRLTAARAVLLDNLGLQAPNMSWAGTLAKVIVPGTGADLTFPSVVVAGIPASVTLKRVDAILVVSFTLDSSTAENQIKIATTDEIHVKASGAAWSTCITAIPVPALSYETGASVYGGGGPIYGNTDIKAIVSANGTYNFQSDEAVKTKGLEATGASLELHVVSIVVRAWW